MFLKTSFAITRRQRLSETSKGEEVGPGSSSSIKTLDQGNQTAAKAVSAEAR